MKIKDVVAPVQLRQLSSTPLAAKVVKSQSFDSSQSGDAAIVTASQRSEALKRNSLVTKANQFINLTNYALGAVESISENVGNLRSIVEQVAARADVNPDAGRYAQTESRSTADQQQAAGAAQVISSLLDDIDTQASTPLPASGDLTSGRVATLDLQNELGKSIELQLPNLNSEQLGIKGLNVFNKDGLLSASLALQSAEDKIEQVRKAVLKTVDQTRRALDELDVARENGAASLSTGRDVEGASDLANKAKTAITSSPASALGSVGVRAGRVLDLLEQ